jgi:hypothetical protein
LLKMTLNTITITINSKLTTLVVIGTDCIGSSKSNYHTITTKMASDGIENCCYMTIIVSGFTHFCLLIIQIHIPPLWMLKNFSQGWPMKAIQLVSNVELYVCSAWNGYTKWNISFV